MRQSLASREYEAKRIYETYAGLSEKSSYRRDTVSEPKVDEGIICIGGKEHTGQREQGKQSCIIEWTEPNPILKAFCDDFRGRKRKKYARDKGYDLDVVIKIGRTEGKIGMFHQAKHVLQVGSSMREIIRPEEHPRQAQ